MRELFRKKSVKITAFILLFIIIAVTVLQIGASSRNYWRPWLPDYEKTDISQLLEKESLDDADYDELFRQTGLTRLGIDGFLEKGMHWRILEIQKQYFEEQECEFVSFAPFMGYMRRTGKSRDCAKMAILENGDVLYSPSTFFSFIRLGHSAILLDSASGVLAQASGYGSSVVRLSTATFFVRPAFVILRAEGVDAATRSEIASYVSNELMSAEYDLLAGIFGAKAPDTLEKTHCSHLVWYAYNEFGIDIDANGGKIVTPSELLSSPRLSIVQVYGIDPDSIKQRTAN